MHYTCDMKTGASTFMHNTCDMKTGASGPGLLQLYPFFIFRYFDMHLFCVNFVSKISPELLYLET